MKKREEWLDILRGIAMIFVVIAHTGAPELYAKVYVPVFMSAFFFASGYTFSERDCFADFLKHKCKTILVPYFIFGTLNLILAVVIQGDAISDRLYGLLLSRSGLYDDLWFITCLFSCELIFYWVVRFSKTTSGGNGKKYSAIIWGILIIYSLGHLYINFVGIPLPYQFENALVQMPYMALGMFFRQTKVSIRRVKWKTIFICALIYLLLVFLTPNGVNIHREQYGNACLYAIKSVLGTAIFAIAVYRLVGDNKRTALAPLAFVGRNTFVYYALQGKAIFVVNKVVGLVGLSDGNVYWLSPLKTLIIMFFVSDTSYYNQQMVPICFGKN